MRNDLPAIGTAELLALLSEQIPDEFINQLLPRRRGVGRRACFSAAQLWRVHLLSPLSGTHSYNGVVRLLPEQRAWRRFAHLSHRERTPDVRMLHEFRSRIGVSGLRAINDFLVGKSLVHLRPDLKTVSVMLMQPICRLRLLIKKRRSQMVGEASRFRRTLSQARAHALLRRLQEAFITTLAQQLLRKRAADSNSELADARRCS